MRQLKDFVSLVHLDSDNFFLRYQQVSKNLFEYKSSQWIHHRQYQLHTFHLKPEPYDLATHFQFLSPGNLAKPQVGGYTSKILSQREH